jgi:hypothetical protein
MSILKPTVSSIIPFDATKDYVLSFNLDPSTDQCFGNRIIIRNNATNAVVYDHTVTRFLLTNNIPLGTLSNGVIYKITVAYFNLSGTYSSFSDGTIFKCLATPLVAISNLTPNQTIASNSYTPTGSWIQGNGDVLNTYALYLYDSNGVLLQSSPTLFFAPSNVIQYQFTALMNNTRYGIQLRTLSSTGVQVDTEIIYFTSQYVAPTFAGSLGLENFPEQGAIKVTSHAVQIIGNIGSGTVNYIGDDYIDLRNGMIYFSNAEGMTAFSDFTLDIFLKNIIVDVPFLVLASPQGNISLVYSSQYNAIVAIKIIPGHSYMIFGDAISLSLDNSIYIFFQQIGNYLNLKYEIIS